tara:strand:+ start:582 stop:1616 length:1035 start_codon:yes stop_codon:yes gene_type:complete
VQRILITGVAGFIGFHLSKRVLRDGYPLIGIDNINNYYDTSLKISRLKELDIYAKDLNSDWKFFKTDLVDQKSLKKIFEQYNPTVIINLAAQAGVRYSIENPQAYINSNIVGFINILELCKEFNITNLLYASSSSVYGGNTKFPFSEKDPVNHPVSIYAATKRSNELMAHCYSHLFKMPSTALRFFTVYGPWGRPDMAPMIFTKAIFSGKPIDIYNFGEMWRDFTYIDDVVESIIKLIDKPAEKRDAFDKKNPDPSISWAPHEIFNIGNNSPIKLIEFIQLLEQEIGIKAIKKFKSIQKGDVEKTFSDNSLIEKKTGFKPNTSIKKGIKNFIDWYKEFYILKKS